MPQYDRQEALKKAAENLRRQKENEAREEKEYFEKITSGTPWLFFKILVAFCTLMILCTTIDVFVDGHSKKLGENEWKIDRNLYMRGHQSISVDDHLFIASFREWNGHIDNSLIVTYSPIFQTEKKLRFTQEVSEGVEIQHEVLRRRSIFTWFPFVQLFLLIPLLTFIFKAQKPLFAFARGASLFLVLPTTLVLLFFLLT